MTKHILGETPDPVARLVKTKCGDAVDATSTVTGVEGATCDRCIAVAKNLTWDDVKPGQTITVVLDVVKKNDSRMTVRLHERSSERMHLQRPSNPRDIGLRVVAIEDPEEFDVGDAVLYPSLHGGVSCGFLHTLKTTVTIEGETVQAIVADTLGFLLPPFEKHQLRRARPDDVPRKSATAE